MKKLTEFQIKALKAIYDQPGIRANQLSKILWPDSIAHRRSYNTGVSGACRGKGAWLMAGSHMGKLIKKGLVRHQYDHTWLGKNRKGKDKGYAYLPAGYRLTLEGRESLEAHIEEEKEL